MLDSDEIKRYKLGTVVTYNVIERCGGDITPRASDFGHIIGFDTNSVDELVLSVKWADGEITSIHPTNVTILD